MYAPISSEADFDKYRGKLQGKIVLAQPAREVKMLEGRVVLRMTDEDILLIDARAHRTQGQNREDARARLADLIRRALVRPKRRKKTRPGAAAKQRRLDTKKLRSQTKRTRGKLRSTEH